jgi:hypothetical protein
MPHAGVLALHRELLALRRSHPALLRRERGSWSVAAAGAGLALGRTGAAGEGLLLVVSFDGALSLDLASSAETRAPEGGAGSCCSAPRRGASAGRRRVRWFDSLRGAGWSWAGRVGWC